MILLNKHDSCIFILDAVKRVVFLYILTAQSGINPGM